MCLPTVPPMLTRVIVWVWVGWYVVVVVCTIFWCKIQFRLGYIRLCCSLGQILTRKHLDFFLVLLTLNSDIHRLLTHDHCHSRKHWKYQMKMLVLPSIYQPRRTLLSRIVAASPSESSRSQSAYSGSCSRQCGLQRYWRRGILYFPQKSENLTCSTLWSK